MNTSPASRYALNNGDAAFVPVCRSRGVRVGVALWPDQLVFGDVLVRNAAADQLWN
jgi:hypothetical protein